MIPLSGENRIVGLLEKRFGGGPAWLRRGIGDDAAVFCPGGAREHWIATTDMLVEGVDFRRNWTTPRLLGHKSLAANLSDLAAMGARPRLFTVSLAIPPGLGERWILDFCRGAASLAGREGAHLAGGDLSRSERHITVSITALGESLGRRVLYRSGGRPGDLLYVTGVLGMSAAGLRLLRGGCLHPDEAAQKRALRAHLRPEPRCRAGVWLAHSGLVRAMMDLSDGISRDLPRLCRASRVGARIDASAIPVFRQSSAWGCDPLDLGLHGGEDFELLFAVPGSRVRVLEKAYPAGFPKITRIGILTAGRGIEVADAGGRRRRLPELGFDHFVPAPESP